MAPRLSAPAIAAGHPAAAEAGLETLGGGGPAGAGAGAELLEGGGAAADAAVAAGLASCVAETVMTGLLGGGHALHYDAASGRAENLDCFVAVPGLGSGEHDAAMTELEVEFGTARIHYSIGPASFGVPGVPAGLDALWR